MNYLTSKSPQPSSRSMNFYTAITHQLLGALDSQYNVVDMATVSRVIDTLEKSPITIEILETTLLGKHINRCRKQINDKAIARKAKRLIVRWRNMAKTVLAKIRVEQEMDEIMSKLLPLNLNHTSVSLPKPSSSSTTTPFSYLEITNKLLRALDSQYNVVDMTTMLEVLGTLERKSVTREVLETTRLGKHINELRKRTKNEVLARRAKLLVRKWRDMVSRQGKCHHHSNNYRQRRISKPSNRADVKNPEYSFVRKLF